MQVLDKMYQMNIVEQEICLLLHDLFMTFPNIHSKVRYNIPFYYQTSWVCYLNPQKQGGVELVFLKGKLMSNHQAALRSNGRKLVSGLYIRNADSVNLDLVTELFCEALMLGELKSGSE